MKATTLLPLALAYTAAAELQLYSLPNPAAAPSKRDLDAVKGVFGDVSDALTQLDTSVKAFESDAKDVEASADALVTALKDGSSTVASSAALTLEDAADLQTVAADLGTAGSALLADLRAKKAAFEASSACAALLAKIGEVGTATKGLVDAVVGQLPETAQEVATQLADGITGTLGGATDAFTCSTTTTTDGGEENAETYPTDGDDDSDDDEEDCSTTSAAVPVTSGTADPVTSATPEPSCFEVTVTVTAPCACDTPTVSSSVSVPVVTPSASVPYPTGSSSSSANSTIAVPTGGVTTTPTPIATAGASSGHGGVGAAGLLAGLAAALFV